MYRGGEGMWSWILHRASGVAIFIFLLAHIIDTMLIGFGPEYYNAAMALYRAPFFRVGEVVLAAAVLYHAINGVRIIIIDFWPEASAFQQRMFWIGAAVFVIVFVPGAYLMLKPLFS